MKVKVRIAVAVDERGEWAARGTSIYDNKESMRVVKEAMGIVSKGKQSNIYFVEAELDVPEVKTVQGDVVEVKG